MLLRRFGIDAGVEADADLAELVDHLVAELAAEPVGFTGRHLDIIEVFFPFILVLHDIDFLIYSSSIFEYFENLRSR